MLPPDADMFTLFCIFWYCCVCGKKVKYKETNATNENNKGVLTDIKVILHNLYGGVMNFL